MRTVTIEKRVGTLEELSPELQEKVIDHFREFVSQDYDLSYVISEFCDIANEIGLVVDENNVHFSGFYCQSDGSSFSGKVTNPLLFIGKEFDNYKKWFSSEKEFNDFKRWCTFILTNNDFRIDIKEQRGYDVYANVDITMESYYRDGVKSKVLKQEYEFFPVLERMIEEKARGMNFELYKNLESEYEYCTSDDYIIEFIEANGIEFNLETGEEF